MILTYGYHKLNDKDEHTMVKIASKGKPAEEKLNTFQKYIADGGKEEDMAARKAVGTRGKRIRRHAGHIYGKSIAGSALGAAGGGAAGGILGGAPGAMAGASLGGTIGSGAGMVHGIRSVSKKEEALRNAARKTVRRKRLMRKGKAGLAVAGLSAAGYGTKKYLDNKKSDTEQEKASYE